MTKTSLFRIVILTGALVAAPLAGGAALAHGSMIPEHGGQVTMTGETLVEFVRGPRGVAVFVSEEDEPLAATGFKGKLIVSEGPRKREAVLKSGPGNRFDAAGIKIARGAKVTVSLVSNASQARTMASFTVK